MLHERENKWNRKMSYLHCAKNKNILNETKKALCIQRMLLSVGNKTAYCKSLSLDTTKSKKPEGFFKEFLKKKLILSNKNIHS